MTESSKRRLPGFRLIHLLVLFVVVAIGIVAARDWLVLRHAREDAELSLQLWEVGRVSLTQAVSASELLYDVEWRSYWVSTFAAREARRQRLAELKAHGEVFLELAMFGENGRDQMKAEVQAIDALLKDCND